MKSKTGSLGQRMYLLRLLVKRNIKNQYYRSFIGVLWTVLNPLLNMAVMAFVFSQLFGRHTGGLDYPIYLLSGNIIFGIMRASTSSFAHLPRRADRYVAEDEGANRDFSHRERVFRTRYLRLFVYSAAARGGLPRIADI